MVMIRKGVQQLKRIGSRQEEGRKKAGRKQAEGSGRTGQPGD